MLCISFSVTSSHVKLGVTDLQEHLHEVLHLLLQFLVALACSEEIERLHPDRIDRMACGIESLPCSEIFEMLDVFLEICIHLHVYLIDVQS